MPTVLGEFPPISTTSSVESEEPLQFLTSYDNLDDEPIVHLSTPADSIRISTAARLQRVEDAPLLQQTSNPHSRKERARGKSAAASISHPLDDDSPPTAA